MSAPVNRIESRRQSHDCAMWSLSVYLGMPYERVCEKVAALYRDRGESGLTKAQMQKTAQALGVALVGKRKPDLAEDYGMLIVEDHVVVLRNGLVFDTDATVWDVDDWLRNNGYSCCALLVTK